MKKLFVLFFFLPLLSFGQNWQTVPVGQHNIYRVFVPLSAGDSIWDGYVRNIYIENSVPSTNGTQHNFYRSLRRNENEILDSIQGPTWLGRSFFRKNNGDEIYSNKYLDSILIKTKANYYDSWTMAFDSSGTKRFEARVIGLDTVTIDGVLDSIKAISIQAFIGNFFVNSFYDPYYLVLSKNHGFRSAFDLYGFPNYETPILGSNPSLFPDTTRDIFPTLPYIHFRIDSSVASRNYAKTDMTWQYQAGNQWILQLNGPGKLMPVYQYDSIQSVAFVNTDTAIVTIKRELLSWQNVAPPPFIQYARLFSTSTITDTIMKQEITRTLRTDSFENKTVYPSWDYEYHWSFVDFYCDGKIAFRDTNYVYADLSGDLFFNNYFLEDFNLDGFNNMAIHQPSNIHDEHKALYVQLNGCSYGNFFSLRASSVSNFYNRNDLFKIYPNPTSDRLHIKSDLDWHQIDILSMQGKIVRSFSQAEKYNMTVNGLPSGLYLVKVSSDAGNYIYKIMKD